jgi:hypothetical protein
MTEYFIDALEISGPVVDANSEAIRQLRYVLAIHGKDGNWDVDGYSNGMFNGMELALSIMEDRDPVYRLIAEPTPAAPKPAVVALPAAPTAHPAIAGLLVVGAVDHRLGSAFR